MSVTIVTPAPDKTVFRLTKNKHKLQILTGQVVWPAEELPSKHISLIGTTGSEQTLRKEAVDGKSDVKKVTNKEGDLESSFNEYYVLERMAFEMWTCEG